MVDIPGNGTTSRSISVGGTITDSLEVVGDRDWIRINLTAGQSISVFLDGLSLEDPYLRIRDASGNVLFENDDISSGTNRDSLLAFTASYTGAYYIEVGAWEDNYAGTYSVSVSTYTPPPLATIDQVADQLVSGYWDGDTHHFNATQGGAITVNLTALTGEGQALARAALAAWTDIIGVNFVEVGAGGQITFDDNGEGAFSDGIWSSGIISSARVNVSTDWIAQYGATLNSYTFQAYIHEIGHAIGLGHAGNYNETARYPFDAQFQNDSWSVSIMSYFDQQENTYFAGQGFSQSFLGTPMLADIVAASRLYGLSTTTRTGDTIYGFDSTAVRPVYDANAYPTLGYTVFDSAGNDTLNYSGFSQNQRIDLNSESYSNVGGRVGNVSIGRGVVIENAIGGSGSDVLIGNSVDNRLTGNGGNDTISGGAGWDTLQGGSGIDRLTGGAGNDVFVDSGAGLNGDTITDFAAGDRIVISNASLSGFTYSLSGSTLSFTGGSITLAGFAGGTFFASAAAGGGVQLSLTQTAAIEARNDFNGDGRSDILWRNENGEFSNWLGTANGGFAHNDANAATQVSTSWKIAGTGDFNGDGRADVLWRNDGGALSNWLANPNGGFTANDGNAFVNVSTAWKVVGTGDFNGDGRADILWRHDGGALSDWLANPNGSFSSNDANAYTAAPTSWHIVGTGDFNGDGRDDILWRSDSGQVSDWLAKPNGGFTPNDGNALTAAPLDWHIVGTGDFNGDGRDDILWRSDSGALSNWLGGADGGFTVNDQNAFAQVATDWFVEQVGDFNGDGRDDILWRHDSGSLSDWLATSSGGFASNDANAFTFAPPEWHPQPTDIQWV